MRLCLCGALLAALIACAGGCAKDACEEAYDKVEDCVAEMNCSHLDPMQQPLCEQTKALLRDQNETLFKIACDEQEAQKVIDCQLDPTTCLCPGQ